MDFLGELRTLKDQVLFSERIEGHEQYSRIVIAGMGGSGIAGRIFQELYSKRPVITVDDYHIPEFVDSKTLFISMSYSGNTEEVLSSTEEARKRKARVVAVTSGGRLSESADEVIQIRGGLQPRSSLGYMLMPLLNTFMDLDDEAPDKLRNMLKEMDDDNSKMKAEAEEIFKRELIPVIYGFSPFRSIAYRWRTQFNENSKILALSSYFPELDHNEIVPLKPTYRKDVFRFYTFDCAENPRIQKRIDATEKVTGTVFNRIEVPVSGNIGRAFFLVHYGDYLTYHLANLRGIDPTDVSSIENLKKLLSS